jgi:thiol:disulfide interchange protein
VKFPRWMAVAGLMVMTAGIARPAGRNVYPDPAAARADIAAALKTAAQTHKRVLLDFGADWCGDCIVLDMYLHNEDNRPLLDANFVLVHVNVGTYDANLDLAKKYGIPLEKGVPAMVVLSETGKLLYSQRGGEFEKMRRLQPEDVRRFLVQWKPSRAGCSVVAVNC